MPGSPLSPGPPIPPPPPRALSPSQLHLCGTSAHTVRSSAVTLRALPAATHGCCRPGALWHTGSSPGTPRAVFRGALRGHATIPIPTGDRTAPGWGPPTPPEAEPRARPHPPFPRADLPPLPPIAARTPGTYRSRGDGRGRLGLRQSAVRGALGAPGGERPVRVGGSGAGGQPGVGAVEPRVAPLPGVGQLGHVPQAESPHHGGAPSPAPLRALRPDGGGRGVA